MFYEHKADLWPSKGTCFSKKFQGTVQALLHRQLSAMLEPSDEILEEYADFLDVWFDAMIFPSVIKYRTIEEHFKNVESSKKNLYWNGWKQLSAKWEKMCSRLTFTPMMKAGEVNYDNPRPRMIMNPQDHTLLLLTAVNADLISILKETRIAGHKLGVCHGVSPYGLCILVKRLLKNLMKLAWDGSQHDSHQHKVLMDLVDSRFLRMFLSQSLLAKGVPVCYIDDYIEQLTSNKYSIKLTYPKSNAIAIQGTLEGTVFSGHTLSTTLGNTLRVLSYCYFVAYKAGIPFSEVQPLVAGDDAVVGIAEEKVEVFKVALHQVYATSDTPRKHGLGQVLKLSSFMCSKYMTLFLSKFIFFHPITGDVSTYRLPQRFVHTGHITDAVREVSTVSKLTAEEHATAVYMCMTAGSIPTVYKRIADYVMPDRLTNITEAHKTAIKNKYKRYSLRDNIFEYKQAYGKNLAAFSKEFLLLQDIHHWRNRLTYNDIIIDTAPLEQ